MKLLRKVIEFIKHGVWEKDETEVKDTKWGWLLRPFKIIIITAQGLGEHKIGVSSAALTFYTLTAIVPLAALVFGIMKGFGFDETLIDFFSSRFPNYPEAIAWFRDFLDEKLLQTRGGIVASAALLFLIWSVMKVFSSVERAFNNIWEIKKQRGFARKFTDYMAVLFIVPILWSVSNTLIAYIRSSVASYTTTWISDILFSIISIVAMWVMFTFVYYVLPNTRVKLKGAFIAGVIAGTAFMIFQWAYVLLQSYMTSYNAIYGALAIIPFFLIWLNTSWQILLVGAEISFAYQNISKYEMERDSLNMSANQKRKITMAAMIIIIRHFLTENKAITSETISEELNMPLRPVRDVIYDLENAGLVVAIKSNENDKVNLYMPAREVHTITAWDVINSIDNNPHSNMDFKGNPELENVSDVLDKVSESAQDSVLKEPLVNLIDGVAHVQICKSEDASTKSAKSISKK